MRLAWKTTRHVAILLLILALSPFDSAAQRKRQSRQSRAPEQIVLAEEGTTRYRIVLPSAPSEPEKEAAEVLRRYLLQISSAAFPVVGVQEGYRSEEHTSELQSRENLVCRL